VLAAFGLLARDDVPVLVDFEESIVDEADQPLACVLPPRHDPSLHPAVDEAIGLRAAYERHYVASSQTNVKRLGGADRVPELIASFVAIVEAAWDDMGMKPAHLRQAALDIRAYYEGRQRSRSSSMCLRPDKPNRGSTVRQLPARCFDTPRRSFAPQTHPVRPGSR
jgi:hypothetical protein